ncbi:hypothetical protein CHUAL_009791 [Chamberlinius hualienensis]
MVWVTDGKISPSNLFKHREKYDHVGLGWIWQMFRFYGFRLCNSNSINKWIYGLGLAVMLIIFGFELFQAVTTLISHSKIGKDEICPFVAVVAIQITIVIEYIYIAFIQKKFGSYLDLLVDVISNEILPQSNNKPRFWKTTKLIKVVVIVTIVLISASLIAINLITAENLTKIRSQQFHIIGHRVLEIVYCVWIITVVGCCGFFNFLSAFLSVYLAALVDVYMYIGKEAGVGEHHRRHQVITRLLKTFNEIFSIFLVGTLTCELILIISYTRGINHPEDGSQMIDEFLNAMQIAFLILKNFCCSSLNAKVKAHLRVPGSKLTGRCSSHDINYILYLDQQANDPPEITYGDIFPISKTFIFTVAGTAFSYAMILREL